VTGGFSATVGKFATDASARVERIGRAVVLKIGTAIIMDTPVKTGRARSNWQTSIGSPLLGEIPNRGAEALAELHGVVAKLRGNFVAYIRNNLPYIHRLEFDGWSKQAPEGMFRKNVARITRLVNEAIQEGRV